jgi:hypothetical protein
VEGEELGVLLHDFEILIGSALKNGLYEDLVLVLIVTISNFAAVNTDVSVLSTAATDACVHLGLALLLLLNALALILLVDERFALCELVLHGLDGGGGALHPWVCLNFGHTETVSGIELEHAGDKVAEGLREELEVAWLVLGVCSPEEISAVGTDELVEGIYWLSSGEGRMLSHHNKEDDGAGK